MSNTNRKIVSLVSNELTKSRQQSAQQQISDYIQKTRTAVADVRHRLGVVQNMIEHACGEPNAP